MKTPSGQRRVRILCEDRRTERFARRLCERYQVRIAAVDVAPDGKGAASAWVRNHYAAHVAKRRSKSFQTNLGLLVVIDGDNLGVVARMQELDDQLDEAKLPRRASEEPIAVFVPTWSIETWLAHLAGVGGIEEGEALKNDGRLRMLWVDGTAEAKTIKTAVTAWNGEIPPLPSLQAAYDEAPRVGLTTR